MGTLTPSIKEIWTSSYPYLATRCLIWPNEAETRSIGKFVQICGHVSKLVFNYILNYTWFGGQVQMIRYTNLAVIKSNAGGMQIALILIEIILRYRDPYGDTCLKNIQQMKYFFKFYSSCFFTHRCRVSSSEQISSPLSLDVAASPVCLSQREICDFPSKH